MRWILRPVSSAHVEIEGESIGLAAADLALDGPLRLHLILVRRGDEIWIRGRAEAHAPQECSRCLAEFTQTLELEFAVFCDKVRASSTIGPSRLDDEDGGIHFHDGRVLSIDEEIREAVLLGMPMQPLCRESCLGLCPRCGEDRNQGPCRCERGA